MLIDALPLLEKTEVDPAVCSLLFLELVLVTTFLILIKMIMRKENNFKVKSVKILKVIVC